MSEQGGVNRRIAEALGYSVKYDANSGYSLLLPDGTEYGAGDCSRQEYLQAFYASVVEAEAWALAPDYEHSLDAVAAELAGKDVRLELDFEAGMATIYDWNEKRMEALEYPGASVGKVDAVEAAARALLAFAQARRGEGV